MSTAPVADSKLNEIANTACTNALKSAESYNHSQVAEWNSSIINSILQSLISETSKGDAQPNFKFAVNSTIIQHLSPSASSQAGTDTSSAGRRGMHSAIGAYWNNEKDGMWSFKYEGGEKKGMDVVVSVVWVAI